jgi:hypothetical protein
MDATQQTRTVVQTGSQSHVAPSGIKGLLLAAIAAGAILAASALSGVVPLGGSSGTRLAEDRTYDKIESMRGGVVQGASEDHTYDSIERARGGLVGGAPEDHGYDAIERVRGGAVAD